MHNGFDWNLVRSFLAALEHGSLLGAARALRASQPTLGRHVAELEAQLGVVLFERTGRGLLPTAEALRLADAARAMESGAHQLARFAARSEPTTGTVRISASQTVACYLLPPILAQLRRERPGIQIELVASNAVSNLLRREADIALRMVQPDQASLVAKRIAKIPLGAYAHRDYLRRRGTPKVLADLLVHDIISDDRNETVRRAFEEFGFPVGKEAFVLRTDDLIASWEAVRAGIGIGFVTGFVAATDPAVLAIQLQQLKIPPLPVWLTVHREIRSSPRIRTVYDFLAHAIPLALPG